jgi:hypothetical protein
VTWTMRGVVFVPATKPGSPGSGGPGGRGDGLADGAPDGAVDGAGLSLDEGMGIAEDAGDADAPADGAAAADGAAVWLGAGAYVQPGVAPEVHAASVSATPIPTKRTLRDRLGRPMAAHSPRGCLVPDRDGIITLGSGPRRPHRDTISSGELCRPALLGPIQLRQADRVIQRLRYPARLLALVGVGIVAVAAFQPWVTTVDVNGVYLQLGGFNDAADGLMELVVGAGLLVVLASHGAQTSRVRTLQLLPAILGLVCLFIALDALRAAQVHLDGVLRVGGHGQLESGLFLLVFGASVALAGGLGSSLVVARANPLSPDASQPPVFDRAFVGRILVGAAGFLVGMGVAVQLAHTVLGAGPIAGYASLYGAIFGGFLGTGLAVSAWRRLRLRPR